MKVFQYQKLRLPLLGLTGVALVLFVVGTADISHTPYLGYRVSSTYLVVKIDDGGPAAHKGLRVGDQIVSIGGTPTEHLYQLSQQARPQIGETQELGILRDQSWQSMELTATAIPRRQWLLAWSSNLVALAMIGVGLAVFWKKPTKPSLLFFLSSFFLSLSFMTSPYLESFFMRQIVALNFVVFLTMGLAFLLHLSVIFPKPKPSIADTPVEVLIYFPVPLLAFFFVSLRLFQPWADLRLNQFLHYAFALLVVYCLTLTLAAISHSFWTSGRSAAWAVLLVAFLIGAVPPAVGILSDAFFPLVHLAGQEYFHFTVILASLAFAWVLSRESFQAKPKSFVKAA